MDQVKYIKQAIQNNFTEHEYHVQDRNDAKHITEDFRVPQHSFLYSHFMVRT